MRYVLKKIFEVCFILLGISVISFCLVHLAPGDAAEIMLRQGGRIPTEEAVTAARIKMGLDKPLYVQYLVWLRGVLHGDFGTSYSTGRPVLESLIPAIKRTFQLAWRSFLLTVVISIPVGLLCAVFQDRMADKIIRFVTYVLSAVPVFVIGIGILYLFSVKLRWLPAISNNSRNGLVMPVMVMTMSMSVWMIRQVRTIIAEKKRESYVYGLRSKGISELRIFFCYILKDALIPILTSLGICFGSMMAGTALVENIFSWSGLGKSVLTAINARDYPLIQGFVLWIGLIYYGINLILDFSYYIADPRIKKGD
ncbi:MAG: ABC transporter permease [Clostridiales bacterium]|nr:ABC transporter permease [Clostridiales bacterium]MDY3747698.1 ABC transporter permease [Lachnospiraceae bacterium]